METNRQKEEILNLPNTLSFLRLGAIPLVIICLYFPGRVGSFLAALIFGAAFITDLLDGYYARRYNEVTIFGKFLDPLADKILVCVTLIMLIPMNRVPALMVMLIIAREIAAERCPVVGIGDMGHVVIYQKDSGIVAFGNGIFDFLGI